jgi:putative intracellular protease/amidase
MLVTKTMIKVLIVVTSHNKLGDTTLPTGYYLPEVSHPTFALEERGIAVDIMSPQGGEAPMDEKSRDLTDPFNKAFLQRDNLVQKIKNTLRPDQVKPTEYSAKCLFL